MNALKILLDMAGGLAMFLFGMQLSSDGIQKSAGERLQKIMNVMTGNRVVAMVTGFVITVLVQSSSASTVMIVTFVNAGLLDLVQAIGCIMGANVGTTVTGWIISLVGFKFSLTAVAVPVVGIGFFMSLMKKRRGVQGWGEALMGFGFIFLGLEFLAQAVPKPGADALEFLARFSGLGPATILICVFVGLVFTAIVNASSAALAIIITLAINGVLDFRMAAALILGANIGTCVNAFIASFGTNVAARRAAWAHILFNVFGTVWAIVFFDFFLGLVDHLVPGAPMDNIALNIAMLHTVFNALNALILLPLVRQFAAVVSWIIKPAKGEEAKPYRLAYVSIGLQSTPELNLVQARAEIAKMSKLAREMFERFRSSLVEKPAGLAAVIEESRAMENYADEMKEELSRFLVECSTQNLNDRTRASVAAMLKTVDDLENITDVCHHLVLLLEKAEERKYAFDAKELERLAPYTGLVDESLSFVETHVGGAATPEEVDKAAELEGRIDDFKSELKKIARKRLESGGNVRTELLFIDIVRNVEKVADYAFSVALNLGASK